MPSEQLQNCWVLQGIWYNQKLWLFSPSFSLLSYSDSSALKSSPAVKSVAGNKINFFISRPQDIRLLSLYHPIQSDIHKNVNQPATHAPLDDTAKAPSRRQPKEGSRSTVTDRQAPERTFLKHNHTENNHFPFVFSSASYFIKVELWVKHKKSTGFLVPLAEYFP